MIASSFYEDTVVFEAVARMTGLTLEEIADCYHNSPDVCHSLSCEKIRDLGRVFYGQSIRRGRTNFMVLQYHHDPSLGVWKKFLWFGYIYPGWGYFIDFITILLIALFYPKKE